MGKGERIDTVIAGNDCIIDVEQIQNVIEKIEEYDENDLERKIINVTGEGGVGKTTLLKRICEIYTKEKTNLNGIYYVEASACSTDVDILYLIARSIGNAENKGKAVLKKYEVLYECYRMARKQKFTRQTGDKDTNRKKASDLLNNFVLPGMELINNSFSIIDILNSYMQPELILQAAKVGVSVFSLISAILGKYKKQAEEEPFLRIIEQYNSDYEYRKALRETYTEEIMEWQKNCEKKRLAIIIDNYALTYSRELYYDSTWLRNISQRTKCCWIVGSRNPISARRELIEEIKLQGFNKEQTGKYLTEYIPEKYTEKYKQDEWNEIKTRIMDICGEGENIYLPYKLRLVCDYVIRNSEEELISVDKLENVRMSEFVSYYFFSDMPEMIIAAVQLLSCLSAWSTQELEILKRKFNYHYLEARYLLQKCASVECLDNGEIKLHEAIKDAINQSDGNFIIYDAEEYLFQELGNLFLSSTSEIYDIRLVKDYFIIAYDFIKRLRGNQNTNKYQQIIENFKQVLGNVYDAHKTKEIISEEFEIAYGEIVETLFKNGEDELLYFEQKLLWADLCTKLYKANTAQRLEEECVTGIEELLNNIRNTENTKNIIKCYMLLIKACNWVGYDSSKSWEYEKAMEYGSKGLRMADELVGIITGKLEESILSENIAPIRILKEAYSGRRHVTEENSLFSQISEIEGETYSYKDIEKALKGISEIKNSMDDEKVTWYLTTLLTLFKDQYVRLRGNEPWYVIRTNGVDKIVTDPVRYGISTYWIRKAFGKEGQELARTSMKNIAVYLYKSGEGINDDLNRNYQIMLILQELIEQCQMAAPFSVRGGSVPEQKIKELVEDAELMGVSNEKEIMFKHLKFLYESILIQYGEKEREGKLSTIWSISQEALEPISYLGELYLLKYWYKDALFKFAVVLLNRYVRTNVFEAEILDAYCRCGIALYGIGDKKGEAKEFMENVCRIAKSYTIECPKKKQDYYKSILKAINEEEDVLKLINILND